MTRRSETEAAAVPATPAAPSPPRRRRAWGKMSHEDRYRRQRSDLLRSAARLASRNGYEGTRVGDIVAEAGLSKSTFYEHFASKEDCFVELHGQTSAHMIAAGAQAAAAADAHRPYETILVVIRALVGYVERDPRLAEALRAAQITAQPAVRAQAAETIRSLTTMFESLGRNLKTEIPDADLHLTATIFIHGVIEIFPELEGDLASLDARLEGLARFACRALELSPG